MRADYFLCQTNAMAQSQTRERGKTMAQYPVRTVYYLDQVVEAETAEEAYLAADRGELDEVTLDRLGLTFSDRLTVSEADALPVY